MGGLEAVPRGRVMPIAASTHACSSSLPHIPRVCPYRRWNYGLMWLGPHACRRTRSSRASSGASASSRTCRRWGHCSCLVASWHIWNKDVLGCSICGTATQALCMQWAQMYHWMHAHHAVMQKLQQSLLGIVCLLSAQEALITLPMQMHGENLQILRLALILGLAIPADQRGGPADPALHRRREVRAAPRLLPRQVQQPPRERRAAHRDRPHVPVRALSLLMSHKGTCLVQACSQGFGPTSSTGQLSQGQAIWYCSLH